MRTCVRTQEGFYCFCCHLVTRHLQSSIFNVPLDLRSLAKQECSARPLVACKARIFFPAKIQQAGRSNMTFRSFRFFSFDKS